MTILGRKKRQRLEEAMSALEGPVTPVAFTSGMTATSICFELFQPGDHIVCSEDLYDAIMRLLRLIGGENRITFDYWTPETSVT